MRVFVKEERGPDKLLINPSADEVIYSYGLERIFAFKSFGFSDEESITFTNIEDDYGNFANISTMWINIDALTYGFEDKEHTDPIDLELKRKVDDLIGDTFSYVELNQIPR